LLSPAAVAPLASAATATDTFDVTIKITNACTSMRPT
jgi:hypothetical protein